MIRTSYKWEWVCGKCGHKNGNSFQVCRKCKKRKKKATFTPITLINRNTGKRLEMEWYLGITVLKVSFELSAHDGSELIIPALDKLDREERKRESVVNEIVDREVSPGEWFEMK